MERIYQLFLIVDLVRMDIFSRLQPLIEAQINGRFPQQYEKVALLFCLFYNNILCTNFVQTLSSNFLLPAVDYMHFAWNFESTFVVELCQD